MTFKEARGIINNNPLFLKNEKILKNNIVNIVGNDFFPYSVGIEVECSIITSVRDEISRLDILNNLELRYFRLNDVMDVKSTTNEQRFRLPSGPTQALALLQVYVLAWYINTIGNISSGIHTAFSIWLAFVMPTIAGTAMWNNDSAKISWARFFIQSGYQLIIFIVFGLILSFWK